MEIVRYYPDPGAHNKPEKERERETNFVLLLLLGSALFLNSCYNSFIDRYGLTLTLDVMSGKEHSRLKLDKRNKRAGAPQQQLICLLYNVI